MLLGVDGRLFSELFLEQRLLSGVQSLAAVDREFVSWRKGCAQLGPASALRALVDQGATPFVRALGFSGLDDLTIGRSHAAATLTGCSPPLAMVVCGWGDRLDPLWRTALVESRARGACWCLLFNGSHARLLDARGHASRHVEFDLDLAADDETSFAVMRALLDPKAFDEATDGTHRSPIADLLAESDRHSAGVSRSLKDGVLQASERVLRALVARRSVAQTHDAFEQALTIVYRMLFLLFAEARGLAPLWHPVYRESYSVSGLRDAAERPHAALGLWDALRAISRLAHAGCRAGSLRVTAFNGRLFSPSRTPLAERRDLDDEAARHAVLALSTRPRTDHTGRERIEYRDLGVEQLGAVYETLLDYEPRVESARVSLENTSRLRKSTGTFYTPQSIAQYLVRRTLAPLVKDRAPDEILRLKVLDPAMGSGAFLVAVCGYLAQAYETALVQAGTCHPCDLGPAERSAIRRTIAERCLFGVDLNPMAVQLARLSLWLATLAADKPLGFLDHHLVVGDSVLGTWLSLLGQAPRNRRRRSADDRTPSLFEDDAMTRALRESIPVRRSLADTADDTAEHVRGKERALALLSRRNTALSKWKRVADLWCAQWFSSRLSATAFRALADAILTGRSALPDATVRSCLDEAERVASARRFFHWELEFPEVFFDEAGNRLPLAGFDAIVGNPPWEMIRNDAAVQNSPASGAVAADTFSGVLRFTRDSGVYTAQSSGHANQYQLFVERAALLTRPSGRIGLVVPSGLAMDHGSAPLRRFLFSRCDVDSLVGFENRLQVFPIHRSVRFHLFTATSGRPTTAIACRLGESDPSILEGLDGLDGLKAPKRPADAASDEFAVGSVRRSPTVMRVSLSALRQLSGDGLDVPDLRSPVDLAIAERAAAIFPPLGDPSGWNARFGRELNATEDRASLHRSGRGLPVVEGKSIEPFRVRPDLARWRVSERDAERLLGARHLRTRLAYRDVASATNRQTLIAAILPAGCVSIHTLLCLRTPLPTRAQHFLCGLFNSFVVNYLVRMRVSTHVTTAIVERLPIPPRDLSPRAFEDIAALARLLARGRQTPQAHAATIAQLNARVAQLYQLSDAELTHVLGTFPLVDSALRDATRQDFQKVIHR